MAEAPLPPNWARYTTDEGKEYFHNSATNTTQWDRPSWDGQVPESLSFHSGTSEVYEYRPSAAELELEARQNEASGVRVAMNRGPPAAQGPEEAMPLSRAPGGVPLAPERPAARGDRSGTLGFGSGSLMSGMLAAATEEGGGDRVSGMAGSALGYAQTFFDVSDEDVLKRLRHALLPFKKQPEADVATELRERPDFWGPFWVATTVVLFLGATGNFARLLRSDDRSSFRADYGLISWAATMVYGCLAGVPLLLRAVLFFTGRETDSVNFQQMICVYGYSLTAAIPVSIACLVPLDSTRWIAVLLGFATSLAFMRKNLWVDLAAEAPSLKWKTIGLSCLGQAIIFLMYRLKFLPAS